MRKFGVIVAVLAVCALSASAAIKTDAQPLKITIEANGDAYLTNTSAANLNVIGYEIWSAGGKLLPSPAEVWDGDSEAWYHPWVAAPTTWRSLSDYASVDPGTGVNHFSLVTANSGGGLVSASAAWCAEYSNTTALLSETFGSSSTQYIRIKPASIATPGVYLGKISSMPSLSDLSFFYAKTTDAGDKFRGQIEILPEPATMTLLAIGGIAMIARRRR